MKKLLITLLALSIVSPVYAQTVLFPNRGGTGLGSASPSDVGKALVVSSTSPFLLKFGTVSGGGGSTTTINGAEAPFNFSASSTNTVLSITSSTSGGSSTIRFILDLSNFVTLLSNYVVSFNGATGTVTGVNSITGNGCVALNNTTGTIAITSTCISTSTGLTTANFASPNISQWVNNIGYTTSTGLASTTPFTIADLVVVSSSGALATISSSTYYLASNPSGYTSTTATTLTGTGTATGPSLTLATSGVLISSIVCGVSTCTFTTIPTSTILSGYATSTGFTAQGTTIQTNNLTVATSGPLIVASVSGSTLTLTSVATSTILSGYSTSTGANPSSQCGLSVVNGTANTFMRSDGSCAISQTITPVWTGLHQFSGAGASTTQLWSSSTSFPGFGEAIPYVSSTGKLVPLLAQSCTGTDKVSAVSATGTVTCSADSGGGGGGGLSTSTLTVSVSSTLGVGSSTFVSVNATLAPITINLPASQLGLIFDIMKNDTSTNAVTIDPNGTEKIYANSQDLTTVDINRPRNSITVQGDGVGWYIRF